ncbi:Coatomer subunit epsilon, partial [Zancudomyces culisetae]
RYNLALSELDNSGGKATLEAAKIFVKYHQAEAAKNNAEMDKLADEASALLETESNITDPSFVVILSLIYLNQERYEDSMKLLALHPQNIECIAIMTQAYLMINRVDMAEQLLARSKKQFEESPIYQLAEAWVCLFVGGKKNDRAFYTFDELGQLISSPSVKLMNCQAISKLHLNQYPEAEGILLEAMDKESSNADTLVNMNICSILMEKDAETLNRLKSQLEDQHPNIAFVADINKKAALFDELANKFAA